MGKFTSLQNFNWIRSSSSFKEKENYKKEKLEGIQYLRGIAATLVVLNHITTMARLPKYFGQNFFGGFFDAGRIGVELFFVISGFIIVYISLEGKVLKPILSLSSFLFKRSVRILPFMWVSILGYALLRYIGRGSEYLPVEQYIRAFTLYPIGSVEPKQIWTLRFEFIFYLFFAITILQKRPKWVLLGAWFCSPLLWMGMLENRLSNNIFFFEWVSFFFSQYIVLFGVGTLLGCLYLKNFFRTKFYTQYGFPITILSVAPLLGMVYTFGQTTGVFHTLIKLTAIAFFSGLILVTSIHLKNHSALSIVDKIGLKLGDASYSIYLTHSAIISAILGIWSKRQSQPNEWVLYGVIACCCLAAGFICHKWVEKPLIKITERFLKK